MVESCGFTSWSTSSRGSAAVAARKAEVSRTGLKGIGSVGTTTGLRSAIPDGAGWSARLLPRRCVNARISEPISRQGS